MKKILPSLALSLAFTSVPAMADTDYRELPLKERAAVVAKESMKCMSIYGLLAEAGIGDDFSNNVLSSQAMFMSTVHVFASPESTQEETVARFIQGYEFSKNALLAQYDVDPDYLVDQLYHCEGWREDLVRYMAEQQDILLELKSEYDMKSFYQRVPHPKSSYNLQGATRLELHQFVGQAVTVMKQKTAGDFVPNPFN